MTDALGRHAAFWGARRWVWGQSDCMLFVADYFRAVTGYDAGAAFRGAYHDALGARAAVDAAGGLISIVAAAGSAAGWRRLRGFETPPRGAVGVIKVVTARGELAVGAVAAGGGCAVIYTGGDVTALPAVLLRGWAP